LKIRYQKETRQHTTMKCPHCAATNPNEAIFCYFCGKRIIGSYTLNIDKTTESTNTQLFQNGTIIETKNTNPTIRMDQLTQLAEIAYSSYEFSEKSKRKSSALYLRLVKDNLKPIWESFEFWNKFDDISFSLLSYGASTIFVSLVNVLQGISFEYRIGHISEHDCEILKAAFTDTAFDASEGLIIDSARNVIKNQKEIFEKLRDAHDMRLKEKFLEMSRGIVGVGCKEYHSVRIKEQNEGYTPFYYEISKLCNTKCS